MAEIGGIEVEIIRKRMRHLRLTVLPPDGRVRVSAPLSAASSEIRSFVAEHAGWIEKHRSKLIERHRRAREVSGDASRRPYLGAVYPLCVREVPGRARVSFAAESGFEIVVPPGLADAARDSARDAALEAWYRERLREILGPLVERWQTRMGVKASAWSIKRMKTRWGTCNVVAKRIWFNLELAKSRPECVEYVVVHELAHLIEGGHGPRFKAVMDAHLSDWRARRQALRGGGIV